MSKVILLTGTSSGIGLASALAAARAGFTVVGTVRSPDAPQALLEAGVDLRYLEQTDQQSIVDCVAGVIETYGRLDALVNNAGIAYCGVTLELTDMAVIRENMEVNFFGVIALTQAALPHLRASRGRIVTISSVRGVIGWPFNEGYSAAKHAVEGYLEALAPVAAQVGVAITLIQPAAVIDSAFIANSPLDPVAALAEAGPYAGAFTAYREGIRNRSVDTAQVSADVAAVVVDALTQENPPFRIQTGQAVLDLVERQLIDPSGETVQRMTRSWVS